MSPRLYRGGLQWFEDPSNQPLCMEGNLTCESWSECSHGRSRKFCLCSVLGAAACWFRKASNTSPFSGSVLLLSPQKERPESPRAAVGDRKLSLKTTQKGPGENHSKALSAPPRHRVSQAEPVQGFPFATAPWQTTPTWHELHF